MKLILQQCGNLETSSVLAKLECLCEARGNHGNEARDTSTVNGMMGETLGPY